MSKIKCNRCGCDGRVPFFVGAAFCHKCSNEDDMMDRIKSLESGLDCLLDRLGSGNRLRDEAYKKMLTFLRGMSEGGNMSVKLLLVDIGEE